MTPIHTALAAALMAAFAQIPPPTPAASPVPTPVPTPGAPDPVVERMVTTRGRSTRLVLFSNRVVVVTVRNGGEEPFVRRVTLEPEEYATYLGAIRRDTSALRATGRRSTMRGRDEGARVVWYPEGGGAPMHFEYSLLAALDLEAGRLVATLDDLERAVLEMTPAQAGLHGWQPRAGDRVVLVGGGRAEVTRVQDDGWIVLRHHGSGVIDLVPPDNIGRVISHLESRGP